MAHSLLSGVFFGAGPFLRRQWAATSLESAFGHIDFGAVAELGNQALAPLGQTRGLFFAKIGVFYTTGAVLSMRKLG